MFGPADASSSPADDMGLWQAYQGPFVVGIVLLILTGLHDRFQNWSYGAIMLYTLLILLELVVGFQLSDNARWCSTVYGYCASLSCMAASIHFEWQVFLGILFLTNFFVVMNSTKRLGRIRELRDANPERCCTGKLIPRLQHFSEQMIRLGSAIGMITGVVPSHATPEALCSRPGGCTVDKIAGLHSTAIFVAMAIIVISLTLHYVIFSYLYRNHALHWRPITYWHQSEGVLDWCRTLCTGRGPPISVVAEWLAPVEVIALPIFAVFTVVGGLIYIGIDGTTPWFPLLQICFNHLHADECLHPGFGSTSADDWPCVWDANATLPFTRPCTNPSCAPWARKNAFSILWETHALFFGFMLVHCALARMERITMSGATPAFLGAQVILEVRGTRQHGMRGVARAYDSNRNSYDVEMEDSGVAEPHFISVVPDQLRWANQAAASESSKVQVAPDRGIEA